MRKNTIIFLRLLHFKDTDQTLVFGMDLLKEPPRSNHKETQFCTYLKKLTQAKAPDCSDVSGFV